MMDQTHILVTGGAGFIGSHTCKKLAASGYIPVTLDNLSTGNVEAVKWGPLVKSDLRDCRALCEAIVSYKIKTVIHFAASAYVGQSVENPALYYENNVGGMMSLLEACRMTGVTDLIFSSSCATYGIPETLPISETSNQDPINPYGRTKLICENMLKDYEAAYGLRHFILRYFNACGADPEGELVEKHDPETHIIPLALLAASGRIPHLEIFGTDYETPDGSCIRDYIHVSDLANGHIKALQYLQTGSPSDAVNLGSGKGHSIFELLKVIKDVTGLKVPVKYGPRRIGDPPVLLADPTVAKRILGFATQHSSLDVIIRDAASSFGVSIHDKLCA
jgi:UDP-arabinose 4-epimerase